MLLVTCASLAHACAAARPIAGDPVQRHQLGRVALPATCARCCMGPSSTIAGDQVQRYQLGRVALPVTCARCCMRGGEADRRDLMQHQLGRGRR